jgi:hypothetical protein
LRRPGSAFRPLPPRHPRPEATRACRWDHEPTVHLSLIDLAKQPEVSWAAGQLRSLIRAEEARRPKILEGESRDAFVRWPWLRDVLEEWAFDPTPKLLGLELAAREKDAGTGSVLRAKERQ